MKPGLAASGLTGLAGALSLVLALALLQGRSAPLAAPVRQQALALAPAVAALPAPPAAAVLTQVPPPSVQRVAGKLALQWVDVERRQAVERLAAATGSRLFGAESLPASLGRISLKAAGIDVATAWHLLLDNAPVGFALACDGAACEVWFAPAGPPATNAAPLAAFGHRVESTEGEN